MTHYEVLHKRIREINHELDSIYAAQFSSESEDRCCDLEEELRDIYHQLDSRIY